MLRRMVLESTQVGFAGCAKDERGYAMGSEYAAKERVVCPEAESMHAVVWPDDQEAVTEAPVLVRLGRPPLAKERLVTVAVKMPLSMVAAMDQRTANRSDFVRKAVDARLKSERW